MRPKNFLIEDGDMREQETVLNSFEVGIDAQEGIAKATPEEERMLQTTTITSSYNCSTNCLD